MLCVSQMPSSDMGHKHVFSDHLREYTTPSDLAEAAELTTDSPDLLPLNDAIKQLKVPSETTQLRLFSYPSVSPIFWFCLIENKLENPFVLLVRNPVPLFESATYEHALTLFLEQVAKTLSESPAITSIAERCLAHEFGRLLPSFLPSHSSISSKPYHLFHIKAEHLATLDELEISLPYGYSFDEFTHESDAATVAETSEGTLSAQAVAKRLSSLPYTLIRGPTGAIVSHQLSSPAAGLTHLYTDTDHRRQGLGTSAELKLAQTCARNGFVPFKAVCIYNTSVHRASVESPFWTLLNRNGVPVDFYVEHFGQS